MEKVVLVESGFARTLDSNKDKCFHISSALTLRPFAADCMWEETVDHAIIRFPHGKES
jgi:hypothetical protein